MPEQFRLLWQVSASTTFPMKSEMRAGEVQEENKEANLPVVNLT